MVVVHPAMEHPLVVTVVNGVQVVVEIVELCVMTEVGIHRTVTPRAVFVVHVVDELLELVADDFALDLLSELATDDFASDLLSEP